LEDPEEGVLKEPEEGVLKDLNKKDS